MKKNIGRKTIEVQPLIDFANVQLKRTDYEATKEYKMGVINMLEKILHDSGNYNGYIYNNPEDARVIYDQKNATYSYTENYVNRKYY